MMLSDFLNRLDKVKQRGNQYTALCPAHGDKSPSLSVAEKENKILLHCWANCSAEGITRAMGLEVKDLFTDSGLNPQECKQYIKQKNRQTLFHELDHELMVLCQGVNTRLYTKEVRSEKNKATERKAALRIIVILGELYA